MWGGAGQDGTPAGRFARETTDPFAFQGMEDMCPGRCFVSNKRNPMQTCSIKNPDIPRAIRGGAAHGGAARGRAGWDADGSVRPENNRTSYPPDNRREPSWACLWKHEQTNSYVNRWRNKARGYRERSSFLVADQCTDA